MKFSKPLELLDVENCDSRVNYISNLRSIKIYTVKKVSHPINIFIDYKKTYVSYTVCDPIRKMFGVDHVAGSPKGSRVALQ